MGQQSLVHRTEIAFSDQLNFIKRKPDGFYYYWKPVRTGDRARDWQHGLLYGQQYIDLLHTNSPDAYLLLNEIVKEICETKFDSVAEGFIETLNEVLIALLSNNENYKTANEAWNKSVYYHLLSEEEGVRAGAA